MTHAITMRTSDAPRVGQRVPIATDAGLEWGMCYATVTRGNETECRIANLNRDNEIAKNKNENLTDENSHQ